MIIQGKVATAIAYANVIEQEAIDQIRRMCDYDFTEGTRMKQLSRMQSSCVRSCAATMYAWPIRKAIAQTPIFLLRPVWAWIVTMIIPKIQKIG